MLVSLEWLNEYVDISDLKPEQIAHELTMSGLEVEKIEYIGAAFKNIVVAEIQAIRPHPEADKLRLVTVYNGTETREVVCGAQNIEVGQLVPYASVGSEVLDRKTGEKFTLKPAKIRGIESQGMLCSADELGLNNADYQQEDGILILNRFLSDIKPGQDVKDALNIKEDYVLNVAPTANRGDAMSIIGIAREVATLFNRKLNFSYLEHVSGLEKADFQVEIKDYDTCKYYAIGVLKDIKIKKSPEWMSRRIIASGMRSINNIVDITNYVMLEYGQPLHAFDMDKLNGYLSVRRANEGEVIVTLDEEERVMNKDSVVIATQTEAVALAGVMGGYNSEIDDNTKNIALESAYFPSATTRRSSRSVGLRSEASTRFERGVDIEAVKPALMRAMQLMVELADAKIEGIVESGENTLPEIDITLRFAQIKRVLGIEIPPARCIEILENLGFKLLGKNDIAAKFRVPSYRSNDVTREIDIIEEISRIYGYDKIEPTLPRKTIAAEVSDEVKTLNKIHDLLLGRGFYEVITSSLVGKPLLNWVGIDYDDTQAVKVTNPQSEEHTMLRQSVIPNIINVVKHNFDQGQKNLWIYEVGKTYFVTGEAGERSTGVEEKRMLSGAITGNINTGKWLQTPETDFYVLKGVIESLIKLLNIENRVQYKPVSNISYLHPGRAAEIVLLGKKPTVIGVFGQIHPETQEKCKLGQPVFLFDINLEEILQNLPKSTVRYKELPKYPAVYRDIAFIVPQNISHQDISKTIQKVSTGNIYKGTEIFDVYQGEHIEKGSKSVAYRIHLQDANATLTDEIVDQEIAKIKEGLKKAYPEAKFRE